MPQEEEDQEVASEAEGQWDFFISYASEDREVVAKPLAEELQKRRYRVWLDRFEIAEGEPFQDKILAGLANCRYGLVLLTPNFLRKDWPTRELDVLLAVEAIDDRSAILFVLHNLTGAELRARTPKLADRNWITTATGLERVYDQICNDFFGRADSLAARTSSIPFAEFRAIGVLRCANARCPWRDSEAADNIRATLGTDPGPEFTLAKREKYWFVVCSSCREVAKGPIHPNDAKQIAALGRMVWAPQNSPYAELPDETRNQAPRFDQGVPLPAMAELLPPSEFGVRFRELCAREKAIPQGGLRKFTMPELMKMLQERSVLGDEVATAFKAGELTAEERDYLVALSRKHALPPRV
jgi:hypothetical protein